MSLLEILPGLYGFAGRHGTFNTFAYALGGTAPLLVDTIVADQARALILPGLADLGWQPTRVVITHGHADHFGGLGLVAASFPGIAVAAHPADTAWVESGERYVEEMYRAYGRAAGFAFDDERLNWVRTLISGEVHVNECLQAGQRLNTGQFTLEVVEVPGHSPGHIALLEVERRFAIAADALLGWGIQDRSGQRPFAPIYTDPVTYRATLCAIRQWQVPLLLTGHMPPLRGQAIAAFLDESERFVVACGRLVEESLAAAPHGLSFADLADQAQRRLGPYLLGLPGFPCLLAHLQDLERRGQARQAPLDGQPTWFQAA